MPPASFQSLSSRHTQAAIDHEAVARKHRAAADFYDRRMRHAAQLSAESAWDSCMKAQHQSLLACERSAKEPAGVVHARAQSD